MIMFIGGITYKDLFQGMIEKFSDLTEDSVVRSTINIVKYVKGNVGAFAKSGNDLYYKDVRVKKFIDKYGYTYKLTTSIYGQIIRTVFCMTTENFLLSDMKKIFPNRYRIFLRLQMI